MEVVDLMDEVRRRFDKAVEFSIDIETGALSVFGADNLDYPLYLIKQYGHFSDIGQMPQDEDTWE